MLGIRNQHSIFISEDGLSLLETDAMFGDICSRLRRIPREAQTGHDLMYIQCTYNVHRCVGAA